MNTWGQIVQTQHHFHVLIVVKYGLEFFFVPLSPFLSLALANIQ